MPHNIGEMFYYKASETDVPWHGLGVALAEPADLKTALKVGCLDWQVESMPMMTAEDPPSPVNRRMAFVRSDRPPGHEGRVLGVAHNNFIPVQNIEAAMLFDAIFGHQEKVYHTGGYLGSGERIWLLARLKKELVIGKKDPMDTYALLTNSHDGSLALTISLTTVRVVCQNTLSMALKESIAPKFRRGHASSFREHAEAAKDFFKQAESQLDEIGTSFRFLAGKRCSDVQATQIIESLVPLPSRPRTAEKNDAVLKNWQTRVETAKHVRTEIARVRETGKGVDLETSKGTFWGLLNAVTEFYDHHSGKKDGDRFVHAILGDGMSMKVRAYELICEQAKAAA